MKRFLRGLIALMVIAILAALDSSFFPALSSSFNYVNITLALAIYLLVIVNERIAILLYILTTVLISITSSSFFITPFLSGIIALFFINWLFENFFTNRSYYTLIVLGTICWFSYYLIFSLFSLIMHFSQLKVYYPEINSSWVEGIILGFAVLVGLLTISYFITSFFSKKFRSYFVISDQ